MSNSPKPWTFTKENGARYVKDANGNSIMCDTRYYPWCPDDDEDWQTIVDAVNALGKPRE